MFARLGVTPSRWRAFGFGRAPFLLIAPRTIAKPLTQAIKLDHRPNPQLSSSLRNDIVVTTCC